MTHLIAGKQNGQVCLDVEECAVTGAICSDTCQCLDNHLLNGTTCTPSKDI
ncbi:hypothetical protein DPMN_165625 [Dreissena polymorpha]|uniref:EB domain-containing protein n=1 Tax=Dreissena polymorpha TaxID=45954 RepID=A0A9D4EX76_DREPO|nr:hypothetical protein DPMN_165625 [Dreissena polymorpha]